MENITINHPAVFVCVLANLILGVLWYSPLLVYRGWRQDTGLGEEQPAAMIFSIIALFERRSWRYILISSGFITVYFTRIGLILGLWQ